MPNVAQQSPTSHRADFCPKPTVQASSTFHQPYPASDWPTLHSTLEPHTFFPIFFSLKQEGPSPHTFCRYFTRAKFNSPLAHHTHRQDEGTHHLPATPRHGYVKKHERFLYFTIRLIFIRNGEMGKNGRRCPFSTEQNIRCRRHRRIHDRQQC